MALFSKKKPVRTTDAVQSGGEYGKQSSRSVGRDLTSVLRHARITEKATIAQAGGVYVFDVKASVSKRDIMQAVKALYNVTPRKVSVVNIPKKNIRSMRTGRTGVKGGGRKAYVYLKKGETITIA